MTDHLISVLRFAALLTLVTACTGREGVLAEAKALEGAISVALDLPPLGEGRGNFRRELNIKFLPDNKSDFYQRTHRKLIENLFGQQYLDDEFLLDNISTLAQSSWRSEWEQLRSRAGGSSVADTLVLYVYPEYIGADLVVFMEERLVSGEDCSVRPKIFWSRPNDLYSIEQLMRKRGEKDKLQSLLSAEVEKSGTPVGKYLATSPGASLLQNAFIGAGGLHLVDWECATDSGRPRRREIIVETGKLRGLIRADYLQQ